MAEGFLKSFDPDLDVYSAGTNPASEVHPKAIMVMKEKGINIKDNKPEDVNGFIHQDFQYVITVCNNAKINCPVFTGNVHQKLHLGFDDPAEATGTEEDILSEFRRVRDEINMEFNNFYMQQTRINYGKK